MNSYYFFIFIYFIVVYMYINEIILIHFQINYRIYEIIFNLLWKRLSLEFEHIHNLFLYTSLIIDYWCVC